MSSNSKPDVFVIESNDFEDEKHGYSEGRMLCELLKMMGKDPLYFYIRTKRELREMSRRFAASKYRYLHIGCHGNSNEFGLTLDTVSFTTFATIFRPVLADRRIFLSACDVAQEKLAKKLFRDLDTAPYSLTGPTQDIDFSDAAAVWGSLYNLLFRDDAQRIKGPRLREHLTKLCELNDVTFAHFARTNTNPYFNEYALPM